MTDTTPEGIDPLIWKSFDEPSKKKFLDALEKAQIPTYHWYCKRGRKCDGEPHKGYDYPHARSDQWPPTGDDWLVWLLRGGRGSGKTRSGAEWIRKMSETIERCTIIGPTLPHVRDVMVEGDSGLLAVFEKAKVTVLWEPSKRRITLPCQCKEKRPSGKPLHDNHYIQAFTGEEPERLRGPQSGACWLDEPAHYSLIEPTWDNMLLGLRLGKSPKVLCSTTPLPTKWMKNLAAAKDTVSVTVSTYANLRNLAPTFRKTVLEKYEGTRLGRQELHGEILEDIVGALWSRAMVDDNRDLLVSYKDMDRIVVSIDPAGTSSKKRDETGIIVVGKRGDQFYVLADYSGHYTPEGWASRAWEAFDDFEADKVVAEKNYGGEMVSSTLTNLRPGGPVDLVNSRRGKVLRAEPVVALYEQERVHHVKNLPELEEQMCEWVPDMSDSPDRVDALVHGITKLNVNVERSNIASPVGGRGGGPVVTDATGIPVRQTRGLFGRRKGSGLFGYKPRESARS